MTETGSHVIWMGKPLTSRENGMVGSGWGKTAEEHGLKVQSPILVSGGSLTQKKNAMLENKK